MVTMLTQRLQRGLRRHHFKDDNELDEEREISCFVDLKLGSRLCLNTFSSCSSRVLIRPLKHFIYPIL
jgi:hypothetical protein